MTLSHHEHDLADDLAPLHAAQGVEAVRERERLADVRAQLPRDHPRVELLHVGDEGRRLSLDEGSPEDAHDGAPLDEREVSRELRDATAREADDEEPPLPRDA